MFSALVKLYNTGVIHRAFSAGCIAGISTNLVQGSGGISAAVLTSISSLFMQTIVALRDTKQNVKRQKETEGMIKAMHIVGALVSNILSWSNVSTIAKVGIGALSAIAVFSPDELGLSPFFLP